MTQIEQFDIQSSKIKCGGCVSAIEKGLKDVAGINEVNVDIESNVVTVNGTGLDKEAIENKLAELGYPAQ